MNTSNLPPAGWTNAGAYRRGIALLNEGAYFDAHEVLEDVWREAPANDRQFLQGVIQVAVALHHHSTGNREGAQSLMQRAGRNLAAYAPDYGRIAVDELRSNIARWLAELDRGAEVGAVKVKWL